jgi:hypothetical protein
VQSPMMENFEFMPGDARWHRLFTVRVIPDGMIEQRSADAYIAPQSASFTYRELVCSRDKRVLDHVSHSIGVAEYCYNKVTPIMKKRIGQDFEDFINGADPPANLWQQRLSDLLIWLSQCRITGVVPEIK